MMPADPIEKHFRLIKPQISALRRLGISTIQDLVYHFPARYETAGAESQTDKLAPGTKVTLYGTLSKLKAKRLWKSRRPATEGWFEDATGRVKCMWFNQPYIASYVPEGSYVKLTGTVAGSEGRFYIASPEVEVIPKGAMPSGLFEKTENTNQKTINSLFPVYPESRGITSLWFYHAIRRVFANDVLTHIEDSIPPDVRARYNLPDVATSLVWVHTPEKQNHAEAARKRFAFEEIFTIQTAKAQERALNDAQSSFPIKNGEELAERFFSSLAFPPTGAQKRATSEILQDFEKPHPMARLLEGDVGSGKTLVAAATAYAVISNRQHFPRESASGPIGLVSAPVDGPHSSASLQVAYMAPTEILAEQHFQSFIKYFKHLPINIALVTGSGCKKFPSKVSREKPTDISRSQLLKWVENGEISMLVGTHALIQKSVRFKHLAYAIVDEQHRFGTNQRKALVRRTNAEQTRNDAENIDPLLYRDLTYRIRNALFAVKKELGGGHKESVYQKSVVEEFERCRLPFSREVRIPITYRGKDVGTYIPDFVVDDKIIVELKAIPFVGSTEKKQLWNYLKGSKYRLALLINFGPRELTIERVVFDAARSSAFVPRGIGVRSASVPHFLSMTATPIPRTFALTLYGDLDLSVLDELPPGRARVKTQIVTKKERDAAYEVVRRELASGRQAFVVCPRIEEPDPKKLNALQATSAKAEAKRLQADVFPEYEIGLLHGAMKPDEKENVMRDFASGNIQVLVATSVVEVGINVPNATVMMIEGAERFGLAQLHQLRGRIQRSSHPPHCFLFPETAGQASSKRLKALEKSDDGFALAEADLEARGAGDLFGRRQWGISDLGMEALKNPRLIKAAREEAQRVVAEDASLAKYPALAKRIKNIAGELHSE